MLFTMLPQGWVTDTANDHNINTAGTGKDAPWTNSTL